MKLSHPPGATLANVELVTLAFSVIVQALTVFEDAVNAGVDEAATEAKAPACPPLGDAQFAFPAAVMPVVNCPPEHWEGTAAKAVAVAALPEVLLVIAAGRSAATMVRNVGVPLAPLGAARMLLAV